MKKLNVKKTDFNEIAKMWGFHPPVKWASKLLFVRCNLRGKINWDKAPIFRAEELIERDNVTIKE